jgi:predicted secreted hydrolase
MKNKMTPSEALVAYLKEIPEALRSPQIYPQLVEAAGRVKTATDAAVIFKLLGSGGSCGSKIPQKPLRFPYDHQLHLEMGTEWYWLSCNLEVEGSNGLDRIGILVVIARNRTVSLDVQKVAVWSDEEVQVVDSSATITVATRTESFIVRRRPNVQWPAVGGKVKFETDPFLYQNGPDYLKGSVNVLPLTVHVDDAPNLTIDLKMSSDLPVEKAFFLQGDGTGITPEPKPGLYYSWPQLSVEGKVSVGGKKYAVKGTGWIDHQLLMSDTSKPETPAVPRAPGWVPTQTFNGWSWCQFNLSNGDALAVAAFQVGMLRDILQVPYGWYLRRASDHWEQIYLVGSLEIDRFIPGLKEILMPSV